MAQQDRRILGLQDASLLHFQLHRHMVTPLDIARPVPEKARRGDVLADTDRRYAVMQT